MCAVITKNKHASAMKNRIFIVKEKIYKWKMERLSKGGSNITFHRESRISYRKANSTSGTVNIHAEPGLSCHTWKQGNYHRLLLEESSNGQRWKNLNIKQVCNLSE